MKLIKASFPSSIGIEENVERDGNFVESLAALVNLIPQHRVSRVEVLHLGLNLAGYSDVARIGN